MKYLIGLLCVAGTALFILGIYCCLVIAGEDKRE